MTLPARVAEDVSAALTERGLGARIVRADAVGGGSINHAARIATDRGTTLFLKWNASAPAGMFEAEADGLEALRATKTVRVPEPLAHGGGGASWLLLEHVPARRPTRDTGSRLGTALAALHASRPSEAFGWHRPNWIGSLPQANELADSWGEFYRDRRIAPQLELARKHGHLRDETLDRMLDLIPDALADVDRPELVHGDLWSGNWLAAEGGEPVLIDPAVYLGHGEVDLAMSELFGGFDGSFYAAYDDAHGITPEYEAYRRDLYQLYYLLVHVNLFGASYEAQTRRAADKVVAALAS